MDLLELKASWRRGERPEFLAYWGHDESRPNDLTRACLSHWYTAPFELDGEAFATVEHFLAAEAARCIAFEAPMEDERESQQSKWRVDALRERILAAPSPGEARGALPDLKGEAAAAWAARRYEAAVQGNGAKFRARPELANFLLATEERVLVMASPFDRVWGVGIEAGDERCEDPTRWRGENLAGFALMEVRAELRLRPPTTM